MLKHLPMTVILVAWCLFAAVMSQSTGCVKTRVPVLSYTQDGRTLTNYVSQLQMSPLIEPLGNAASSPWGVPLGTVIVGIGAALLSFHNKRAMKKEVEKLRIDTDTQFLRK